MPVKATSVTALTTMTSVGMAIAAVMATVMSHGLSVAAAALTVTLTAGHSTAALSAAMALAVVSAIERGTGVVTTAFCATAAGGLTVAVRARTVRTTPRGGRRHAALAANVATAGAGPPAQRRASGTVGCHACASSHAGASPHATTAATQADVLHAIGGLCLEGAEPGRGSCVRRKGDGQCQAKRKKRQSIGLHLHRRSIPAGCPIMRQ